ncbi:hypothetical protein [Roseimicrobium sp. ORNL1]|uniref:hypothetical protein n=1 Tax=Roseimicrobium sp. ORNL1 TaxID=2711231 RepID=UPI0013E19457|nr:hypothetical protein [Roseimicrobium sp. ORNL1]QIF01440.1 hypothetical protein G5S37_07865 [Roseimicrobium sp. ORNL1]
MKRLTSLVLTLALTLAGMAHGADGFKTGGVILYQTNDVLLTRAPEVKVLAAYTKAIEAACHEYFTKEASPKSPFYVVTAVKPGKVARVWFITPDEKEIARLEPLKKKLEALPAIAVKEGPVVFAIADEATIKSDSQKAENPPIPVEWQKAAAKSPKENLVIPDDLLALVWPDTAEEKAAAKATVDEFVEQILDPLGGKIPRPKAWHYSESHNGPAFMWTISEQDIASGGGYETGVRIQAFFGLKEKTGKTPKEFLQGFLENKQKGNVKVLSTCEEKEQGMFTRTCLEVEEGKYRILYSLFWTTGDDLDAGVVMISGAPKEQWDRYAPIFNRMTNFQLLDMKKIEADAAKEEAAEGKK